MFSGKSKVKKKETALFPNNMFPPCPYSLPQRHKPLSLMLPVFKQRHNNRRKQMFPAGAALGKGPKRQDGISGSGGRIYSLTPHPTFLQQTHLSCDWLPQNSQLLWSPFKGHSSTNKRVTISIELLIKGLLVNFPAYQNIYSVDIELFFKTPFVFSHSTKQNGLNTTPL